MAILLSIPNEIQLKIAANLNYLDFHQMRLTCKYFYDLPTQPFLEDALVRLEIDFCESDKLASGNYSTYRGVFVDHLVTIGYSARELNTFKHYRVCHECSSILPLSAFLLPTDDRRPPPYSDLERHCGKCYMASAAYLAGYRRWVDFYSSYPMNWSQQILCKTCGELRKYVCVSPDGFRNRQWHRQRNSDGLPFVRWKTRQRVSGKCHECWMADNETWLLSRKQLQVERDALKQKVDSLDEYIDWMDEVNHCCSEGEDERWEDLQQREPRPSLEVSQHQVPQWRQPPA